MQAIDLLTQYRVPRGMPIDYAPPLKGRSTRFYCQPTNSANEFWRLAAALHVMDCARLRVEELEFSTHCAELLQLEGKIARLYEFLTQRPLQLKFSRTKPPPSDRTISATRSIGSLVLFSGGLDSLAAAISSTNGRSLLFHVTTSNIVLSKVETLKESNRILRSRPAYFADCRFSSMGGGFSQTRGLLFVSAAVNAASHLGVKEIVIGENGPLMINPGVSPSWGPTRNAHPRLITDIQSIVEDLGYGDLRVTAVNKDKTKAEVVLEIAEKWGDSIRRSYSCSRTRGMRAMCGLCLGCFVRRLSLDALGISDSPSLYKHDALAVGSSGLTGHERSRIDGLKDALSYYKRFVVGSSPPMEWSLDIPDGFFEDAKGMLRRFSLDLFLGIRNCLRRITGGPSALREYCRGALDEIGSEELSRRQSELFSKQWRSVT